MHVLKIVKILKHSRRFGLKALVTAGMVCGSVGYIGYTLCAPPNSTLVALKGSNTKFHNINTEDGKKDLIWLKKGRFRLTKLFSD
jgi:hypothetical protein